MLLSRKIIIGALLVLGSLLAAFSPEAPVRWLGLAASLFALWDLLRDNTSIR